MPAKTKPQLLAENAALRERLAALEDIAAKRSSGPGEEAPGSASQPRRRAEDKFFVANQRLEAIMTALPVGVCFSEDPTCQHVIGNPAYLAQFGASPDDVLTTSSPEGSASGRNARYFREGREISAAELPMPRSIAEGTSIGPITLEIEPPGGRRWFAEVTATPIRDRQGTIVGSAAVTVDVTRHRKLEEELRRKAEELQTVLQTVPAAVWIAHDPDCRHITGNHAANEILRLPDGAESSLSAPAGQRPTNFRMLADGRLLTDDELPVQRAARGVGVSDYEFSLVFDDGKVHHFLGSASPLFNARGRPRGAIAVFLDISRRKHLEDALKVSESRYRRLFETAKDGILILDGDTGRITDVNPFLQELLGYTHAELIGKRLWEIGPFRDIAANREAFGTLQQQKYIRYENLPLQTKGRRRRHVEFISNVYLVDGAKVIQCNIRDITVRHQAEVALANASKDLDKRVKERTAELVTANTLMKKMLDEGRRTQEQLRQSRERLRNLSAHLQSLLEEERTRISREIHDELGQSLTALKLDLSLIRRNLASDGRSELAAKVHEIERSVNLIIQTVRRVATDLRPGILDELGVAAAIEWMARDFQTRTGIVCTVVRRSVDQVRDTVLSTAIFRIVQEALTNVMRHAAASEVKVSLMKRGAAVVVEVRDNGVGISATRVSNPKSLGILGIRERVQLLGGDVFISGKPGRGTLVRVTLPLA